jgi:hypothetical protein
MASDGSVMAYLSRARQGPGWRAAVTTRPQRHDATAWRTEMGVSAPKPSWSDARLHRVADPAGTDRQLDAPAPNQISSRSPLPTGREMGGQIPDHSRSPPPPCCQPSLSRPTVRLGTEPATEHGGPAGIGHLVMTSRPDTTVSLVRPTREDDEAEARAVSG